MGRSRTLPPHPGSRMQLPVAILATFRPCSKELVSHTPQDLGYCATQTCESPRPIVVQLRSLCVLTPTHQFFTPEHHSGWHAAASAPVQHPVSASRRVT
eukprot:2604522-Rhodomonas_salina.1